MVNLNGGDLMFGCRHDWEVLKTERFDPKITKEQFTSLMKNNYLSIIEQEHLLKSGIISVCKCKKCGEVKHIRTEF